MADIPLNRNLSNNPEAVRKRNNRVVLREKRRKESFVHEYVRNKYPDIYAEANSTYQTFVEKYPEKPDFTKVYYFRKWQEKNKPTDQQLCIPTGQQLYIPHLPVLSRGLLNTTNDQEETLQEVQEETLQEVQEETLQEVQEETLQEVQEETLQEVQEETLQEGQQQSPQQNNDLFSGMSLDEMNIAAEEIVRALQSDRELMDIVENFDLPDSVWDNELSIPDYVMETDLEW